MARLYLFLSTVLLGLFLFFTGCSGGSSTTAPSAPRDAPPENPVVATYGDSSLTLDEFERAYVQANDTPTPAADSFSAYTTFLEQYVNYRLKVRAARAAGLDTLPSVKDEVSSYRYKMARPKVMRKEIYEPLTRTLYERRQEEVDVSHILARVDPDAPPTDTLKAYEKMQAIADSVERGVPFDDLAYRNSEDPSAQKQGQRGYRGRIGYIRAGQIVKPFEDRMYDVPPDSVSDVFRTRFGYHILKVHDRRSAQPPIQLSHIMVRADGDSTRARRLLDSLRTEIVQRDAGFSALAREYSEDRRSASRGGDLGKVESTQSLPPSFRRAVADLDSVGAVSGVVQSRFGYHLLQLTGREERSTFEEAYEDLKKTVSGRPRVERQKERFARQVRSEEGVSVDTSQILRAVSVPSLDTLSRVLLPVLDQETTAPTQVATLGDSTYTLDQVARHVTQTDGGAQLSVGEVLEDFLDDNAFRYAAARLEERDSLFAATMKEYREGLLVFEFMQDSVWDVASRDTAGLRRTYQQNRDEYRHPERVRTVEFRAAADSLLRDYTTAYTDTTMLPGLVRRAQTDSLVTVDTVMVTAQSSDVYRRMLSVDDGTAAGPVSDEDDALFLVRDALLPARPKSFEEARSQVIRDYQKIYEDEVLARLRRRYDVETHPERLRQAFGDGQ
jgi:peptidyl-prolyl cis-trans isomerase SurA